MSTIVNRRDLDFLMYETLQLDSLLETDRYNDYDREAVTAILDLAQSIAEDKFQPFAGFLDENEPQFVDGKVEIIPQVKEAIDAYKEAGLFLTGYDADLGGMQLPWMVHQALNGVFVTANTSVSNYAFLTQGVANMLHACGSDELKQKYLPKLVEGEWFGTMCLSEPQAGSSLADIRTKAERREDGSYKITGTKMWISGGDHEMTDNIIHMVLAKVPGGPEGVKGISLFLVPKHQVGDDGAIGESNKIALAGLNHKMGHRGTTNCLLNFGESGETVGYLVGEENQGLTNMFHMMNEARIGVGMAATVIGLGGYLYSLDYARNRPQGRHLANKDPKTPMVMISEHADVKRMLMTQKVYVEGAHALMLYSAKLLDEQKLATTEQDKMRASLLLELLTPICKSWPSEFCLEANKLAIQILGGYGYTREYPVERYYRDNRLNHIHEGTHAIHGLDILGRKVRMADGAALKALVQEINADIARANKHAELGWYGERLTAAMAKVDETLAAVSMAKDMSLALANATTFLDAMGHVVIAWMWLKQATAASNGQQQGAAHDADFYAGKLAACKFFYKYELPKAMAKFDLVAELDDTFYSVEASQFTGQ
ncbi:acyl-CoA dehydrogenase [Arenicella xantha]|uniref:3-methylmercaptopropionyl-CoA dehydrogenase n=1 Tax=Arenicella xantha TaxID=644221 RepID=A0A395JME6_9GAMM|nr:acyl-CoA dehydrogenase [Arenicella xantha]RBP52719.1 butyryl-CoA dehydrogenase [Arenicella xantha]